jgi:hypothetical protein
MTVYAGDIGGTFAAEGFAALSIRHVSGSDEAGRCLTQPPAYAYFRFVRYSSSLLHSSSARQNLCLSM